MDANYMSTLQQLLAATISPDTNIIKQATTQLNTQFYKNSTCIPALYEISCTDQNQAVRQLAAVELRKRISQADGRLWKKVDAQLRQQMKDSLLQRLIGEQIPVVRHALARVVAAIADIELTTQPVQWPTLLPALYGAAASPEKSQRETAIYVLYSILDTVAESVDAHMKELFPLFAKSLVDPESSEVRVTTMRALAKVAEYIEADAKHDIKAYQELIVPMLQVLQQVVNDDDEQSAKYGFDLFETLLIIEAPLVSKHVGEMVEFFISVGGNKDVDSDIRVGSLGVLSWIVRYKKSKVQSLGLAKPIIERLLAIGCEDDPEDVDEDSPSRLAFRVLDNLSQALPPQQVFPVLTNQLQVYMAGDARMRKSALMAFGVSVEGCSEFIRPHVDQLWAIIESGLQDSEVIVRKAACIALGCLCEWLAEECATRHSTIVPILFNLIVDPSTQKNACTCLDSYLEILGDDIVNYLTLLMERLLVLLENGTIPVKITVTGAIGSAAHAAKGKFTPYFEQTIRRLVPLVQLTDAEQSDLRGVATDTIGTIADAVGAEIFRPFFHDMMKASFEALTMDQPRLRESSFIFFGVMAGVFEQEFAPYLPQCLPALFASCRQLETSDEFIDEADGESDPAKLAEAFSMGGRASSSKTPGEEDLDDEDETDLDALEQMYNQVNSAVAIEKEVAADAIGELFTATKAAFMPFVEESVTVLFELLDHYYEGIRKSVIVALFSFIRTIYELSEPQEWVQGATVQIPFHADVKKLVDHILPPIFEAWKTEDDKSVVILLCSELAETMNKCGPALVEGQLDQVAHFAVEILEKKAMCQLDPDQDDDNVDEDSSEYEAALISNAADVFGAMANVLGPDFAQAFGSVLPLIGQYSEPKRANSERSMAIGSLGEIIVGLRGAVTQFTQQLLQIISRSLRDEEAEVRSNAAFAAGVLVECSDADLTQHNTALLTALQPFFTVPDHSAPPLYNARDNAAGAISRMISNNPTSMPLEQVLPVIVSVLPLRYDTLENRPVYSAIFTIFRIRPELLAPHMDNLLAAFAHVLLDPAHEDETTDETKAEMKALVEHLKSQIPDKVAAAGFQ
ncbi:putative importin beta-4 subunit [Dioszegia hungarica]|uniref:Importin beta-4 subunit n=1 Tax=Dioszegia hungarica TaxID=4972 RepID=A0AA38HBD2_9TREE|nr:putative importin beta-4 subunit [Dioszegia hungarica]KAI9636830.1 putative importin beta-4 subunit [Dioszegia hungarica]